jgi:predicted ABC-type ATPase
MELTRLAKAREDFAFESTLSGRTYLRLLTGWKRAGYQITIIFLALTSPQLALQRIASRVRQGGHDIPRAHVLRRFQRSWNN